MTDMPVGVGRIDVDGADRFGNRVIPRGSERTTARQPPHRQPQRSASPMGLEGLERIRRTTRGESTRRRSALHRSLVPANRPDRPRIANPVIATGTHCEAHRRAPRRRACSPIERTARVRSSNVSSTALGCAPIRYRPGGITPSLKAAANAARNLRRSRLRTTAGPTARPIANARRGATSSESTMTRDHNELFTTGSPTSGRIRIPSRCSCSNS